MKKVLVLQGKSKFRVLNVAADQIAKGFEKKGYEVEVIRSSGGISVEQLTKMITGEYSFIFSCQALLFDFIVNDTTPFLELLNKPYLGWIFDDPIYHDDRIKNVVYPNSYMFYIDATFPDVSKMMYPQIKNAYFLPHGGFEVALPEGIDLQSYKDIDILFSGNIREGKKIEDYEGIIMPIEMALVKGALELLENNPEYSVRESVEKVLNSFGEKMTGDLLIGLGVVIQLVDTEIRFRCKYRLLECLLKHGCTVHVIGEGASQLLSDYPEQVIQHGGMDIEEVVELIGKSKIVINPMSTYVQGIHERIATAMLARAACFTPHIPFLDEFEGELEFIDMRNPEKMITRIEEILENYNDYIPILDKNYEIASEKHTWEKRGEELVDFFEHL